MLLLGYCIEMFHCTVHTNQFDVVNTTSWKKRVECMVALVKNVLRTSKSKASRVIKSCRSLFVTKLENLTLGSQNTVSKYNLGLYSGTACLISRCEFVLYSLVIKPL